MSTAIQKAQVVDIHKAPANPREAIATLRDLLDKEKPRLQAVLPKHITVERLSNVAMDAMIRTPDLMKCTPASVLNAIRQAASLGFEPGGALGDCYLVPYTNRDKGVKEAQFIPGYRGLISLARRSGQVLSIDVDVVHQKDGWTWRKTQDGPQFEHVPSEEEEPGPMVRVYATARLRDTPLPVVIVMSKAQVDAIRSRSRASKNGPWVSDYEEMAKKTAIRRISKLLPMSVEFKNALEKEDEIEQGIAPAAGFADIIDITPEPDAEQEASAAAAPKSGLDSLVRSPETRQPDEAPEPGSNG